MQVKLRIENLGDSRKVEYHGWAGRDFDIGRTNANLHDDLDNSYKRINFGFANKVVGQIQSESIYPGKSISDLLVFEEPIAKAAFLKLELPAGAFDGKGNLRIKIPMSMVDRGRKPEPAVESPAEKTPETKPAPSNSPGRKPTTTRPNRPVKKP